jgi:hypothetical protein
MEAVVEVLPYRLLDNAILYGGTWHDDIWYCSSIALVEDLLLLIENRNLLFRICICPPQEGNNNLYRAKPIQQCKRLRYANGAPKCYEHYLTSLISLLNPPPTPLPVQDTVVFGSILNHATPFLLLNIRSSYRPMVHKTESLSLTD